MPQRRCVTLRAALYARQASSVMTHGLLHLVVGQKKDRVARLRRAQDPSSLRAVKRHGLQPLTILSAQRAARRCVAQPLPLHALQQLGNASGAMQSSLRLYTTRQLLAGQTGGKQKHSVHQWTMPRQRAAAAMQQNSQQPAQEPARRQQPNKAALARLQPAVWCRCCNQQFCAIMKTRTAQLGSPVTEKNRPTCMSVPSHR